MRDGRSWRASSLGKICHKCVRFPNRRTEGYGIILLESYLMDTTRLSTKGQIILPKGIRVSRAWGPGTKFTVEETGEGILLRPAALFPSTHLDEVAGCLRSKRKSKTGAEMRTAIGREVMRRHDRGRY
jgi:AbrB family looped-hinge helix DNA binding protein